MRADRLSRGNFRQKDPFLELCFTKTLSPKLPQALSDLCQQVSFNDKSNGHWSEIVVTAGAAMVKIIVLPETQKTGWKLIGSNR